MYLQIQKQTVRTNALSVYGMNMQHANKSNQPTKYLVETFVNGVWVWSILCISVDVYANIHTHTRIVCSGENRTFYCWIATLSALLCISVPLNECWTRLIPEADSGRWGNRDKKQLPSKNLTRKMAFIEIVNTLQILALSSFQEPSNQAAGDPKRHQNP